MHLMETGFFDVRTEQWLRKYLFSIYMIYKKLQKSKI